MSINASPTSPMTLTLDDIRMFMRDVAGRVPGTGVENIMFDAPEFSDDDARRAVRFTVARFNIMTPISNDHEGMINPWLLLMGTCEFLLTSEAFRQKRNQVQYASADISPIGRDDKFQMYLSMAQYLKAEFEDKAKSFKISRNMEDAYGNLGSGYRFSSRYGP